MKVEILSCTEDFLRVIWCAARTCYSALTPPELWRNPAPRDEMLRLARRIFRSGHHSVIEHCSVTFGVSGVSRTLLAQLSRHRVGVSLSVQSQRYVSHASARRGAHFPYVAPSGIDKRPGAAEEFEASMRAAQRSYDRLVELGVPKEDARFVLPGAAATNLVVTLNLRSLLHLYTVRVKTPGAQWEICELVRIMVEGVVAREPWLAEFFENG